MEWTDEIIARLQELWGQGLSTAEIGRQLDITKNAVVGKAHRLGLPPRPSPIRKQELEEGAARPVRKPVVRKERRKTAPAPESVTETAEAPSVAEAKPAAAAPVPSPAPARPAAVAPVAPSKAPLVPASPVSAAPPAAPAASKSVSPPPNVVPPAAPAVGASAAAPTVAISTAAASPVAPVVPPAVAPPKAERAPLAVSAPPAPAAPIARERPSSRTEAELIAASLRPVVRAITGEGSSRRGPACCWPIGDPGTPGFHFCGAKPLPGKPYCAEHAALAYVKLRDRRDNVA